MIGQSMTWIEKQEKYKKRTTIYLTNWQSKEEQRKIYKNRLIRVTLCICVSQHFCGLLQRMCGGRRSQFTFFCCTIFHIVNTLLTFGSTEFVLFSAAGISAKQYYFICSTVELGSICDALERAKYHQISREPLANHILAHHVFFPAPRT